MSKEIRELRLIDDTIPPGYTTVRSAALRLRIGRKRLTEIAIARGEVHGMASTRMHGADLIIRVSLVDELADTARLASDTNTTGTDPAYLRARTHPFAGPGGDGRSA